MKGAVLLQLGSIAEAAVAVCRTPLTKITLT
jgi:hypothetical protein